VRHGKPAGVHRQTSLYDASNGRNAGGNVEAVTRSGGNDFMEMFFISRNKLSRERTIIQSPRFGTSDLDAQQFGGTSGAVVRDKAFFFVSYQARANAWSFAFQQSNVSIGRRACAMTTAPRRRWRQPLDCRWQVSVRWR